MSLPYYDGDLAALAVARGFKPPGPRDVRKPGWREGLANAWYARGDVERGVLEGLIRELRTFAIVCDECSVQFVALPGPRVRDFLCPKCGVPMALPADAERGVSSLPAWQPRHQTQRVGSGVPGEEPDEGGSTLGFRPGKRVGPYRIEEELARGAMGIVFRARDANLGHKVALKVLQTGMADDEGRQRFEREAQALARVSHPNIVRVLRLERIGETHAYLAMDMVEGPSLEEHVGEGYLEVKEAALLMAKVADGVAALHAANLVHRDLKLANVVLREGRDPIVIDLGLVHVGDRLTRLTAAGDLLGTPLYMAPELVSGDVAVGPAVDVYALGVLFYRLVAGRFPFNAPTTEQLLDAILTEPLELPSNLPRSARAILNTALDATPSERYASAKELADDLRALAADKPVAARLPTPWVLFRRFSRRHQSLVRGVVILAIVTVLGAGSLAAYASRLRVSANADLATAAQFLDAASGSVERGEEVDARKVERAFELLERTSARRFARADAEALTSAQAARAAFLRAQRWSAEISLRREPDPGARAEQARKVAKELHALPLPPRGTFTAFTRRRIEFALRTGHEGWASADLEAAGGAQLWVDRSRDEVSARLLGEAAPPSLRGPADADPPPPSKEGPPPVEATITDEALRAELQRLRERVEQLPQGSVRELHVCLSQLRSLRRLRTLPRQELAHVYLAEAGVLWRLRFWEGAAFAWERAVEAWKGAPAEPSGFPPFEAWPAPLDTRGTATWAPPDVAALCGIALARSEGADGEAALQAASALRERVRSAPGWAQVRGLAAALHFEACALLAELPQVAALTEAAELEVAELGEAGALLSAACARVRHWRRLGREAAPAAVVEAPAIQAIPWGGARDAAAAGWGAVSAYLLAHSQETEREHAKPALLRARWHFRRAVSCGVPDAHLGLAWVATRLGDAIRGRELLGKAAGEATTSAEAERARLDFRRAWVEASFTPDDPQGWIKAAALAEAPKQAGAEIPRGDRFLAAMRAALVLFDGLYANEKERVRLVVLNELVSLVDRCALGTNLRLGYHGLRMRMAERLGQPDTAEASKAALAHLDRRRRENFLAREPFSKREIPSGDGASLIRGQIREALSPLLLWDDYYRYGCLLEPAGVPECFALGFALRPHYTLFRLHNDVYVNATVREQLRYQPRSTLHVQTMRQLKEGIGRRERDYLPLPSPDAFVRPSLLLHALWQGEPHGAYVDAALREAHAAWLEAPLAPAASALQAWARSVAGDAQGAARAFDRAGAQLNVFLAQSKEPYAWAADFAVARAFALQGEFGHAVEALRRARRLRVEHSRSQLGERKGWVEAITDFQRDPWSKDSPPHEGLLLGND